MELASEADWTLALLDHAHSRISHAESYEVLCQSYGWYPMRPGEFLHHMPNPTQGCNGTMAFRVVSNYLQSCFCI